MDIRSAAAPAERQVAAAIGDNMRASPPDLAHRLRLLEADNQHLRDLVAYLRWQCTEDYHFVREEARRC